ncbi:MAG: acetate/propionate family kinase [Candidatus Woesearchaeota archaeon]
MVSSEYYFILKGGSSIKSLEEFAQILKNIDKETFEYHVNDQKNDFANWIRYVFKLPRLADIISGFDYSQRQHIVKAIKKHISEKKILIVNAGSSSIKFELVELSSRDCQFKGIVDAIGLPNCTIQLFLEENIEKHSSISNHEEAVKALLNEMLSAEVIGDLSEIKAIGHRVVHGGEVFTNPTLIDATVIAKIGELSTLAPLHNPHNLSCILACDKVLKGIPQVAVFDTGFHSTISKEKFLYGIPYEYYEKHGIRKYGFHGSSHKYITVLMQEYYSIKKKKNPKYIICHLGNGCSITAVKNGKSFNTTMGFTPTDGLIMGTRSGSLDPYIAVHLEKILNIGYEELGKILNKQSGLLGISGYSDMRMIWKNKKDQKCKLAMEMFADRITHYIGAYISELNGVDGIIFTAGIGENAYYIREMVLENFNYLGLKLDNKKNEKNDFIITRGDSKIECFVIKTNEELQIAQETKKLLKL